LEKSAFRLSTGEFMTASLFLRRAFCSCVILLAVWRFSENTADPDLWGHVLFGQRMIHLGGLERAEPFSWTAHNYQWINHEVGAELAMGATHLAFGGPGLLLLAMATGLFTFLLALRMGSADLKWPQRAVPWAVALLAAKEIAFGFSCRPQIFTAVFLILQLWILRRVHDGNRRWIFALPVLFVIWINTHGGALAGFCVLGLATAATTAQFVVQRQSAPTRASCYKFLWLTTLLSLAALCVNPWGTGLIQWLIGSVLWFRPEISEWNPPGFSAQHAGLFALIALSAFAFIASPRKRSLWEIAVVSALALLSVRHQRHIPLFGIAALALIPPHLADALVRFESRFVNLKAACARPALQTFLAACFVCASLAIAFATGTYKKEEFYTIEVPRDEYPVAAIEFIREHGIQGNMLSFFDWGEQCLWELPESPVSIDGRLDTCYPRNLLREHWNFYDGKTTDQTIFDLNKADFALLRTDVVGTAALKKLPAWKLVYHDPLAMIFVRDAARFPKLNALTVPINRTRLEALQGRAPFPEARSTASIPNPR
jgi:hypothetical protein